MKDSHSFDPGSNPGTSTFLTEHAFVLPFLEKLNMTTQCTYHFEIKYG